MNVKLDTSDPDFWNPFAKTIGESWRDLCSVLGYCHAEIEMFATDEDSDGLKKIGAMLGKWCKANSDREYLIILVEKLRMIQRNDLIKELEKHVGAQLEHDPTTQERCIAGSCAAMANGKKTTEKVERQQVKHQGDGQVKAEDVQPKTPQVVINYNYNLTNCPIVEGDMKDSNINYGYEFNIKLVGIKEGRKDDGLTSRLLDMVKAVISNEKSAVTPLQEVLNEFNLEAVGVTVGCVQLTVRVQSREDLERFWQAYISGEFHRRIKSTLPISEVRISEDVYTNGCRFFEGVEKQNDEGNKRQGGKPDKRDKTGQVDTKTANDRHDKDQTEDNEGSKCDERDEENKEPADMKASDDAGDSIMTKPKVCRMEKEESETKSNLLRACDFKSFTEAMAERATPKPPGNKGRKATSGAPSQEEQDQPTISTIESSNIDQLTVNVNEGLAIVSPSPTINIYKEEPRTTTTESNEPPCKKHRDYNREYGMAGKKTKFDYHDLLGDSGTLPCGEELFNASAMGNTEKVKEIISRHPDLVKFQNKQGQTPLHAAAFGGHMDTVIDLVTNKAPLEQQDRDGCTALVSAIYGDEPDVVKYLLNAGSNAICPSKTALTLLHLAARQGHEKCFKVLLLDSCQVRDINRKDALGYTPLSIAIKENHEPIIQLLVERPDVDLDLRNANQMNSLQFAALIGTNFAVEQILKVKPKLLNVAKNDGFTSLHIAALNGHKDTVLTLLKNEDCLKDLKNAERQTALHLAIVKRHYDCVKALVDNGANVNAQDKDGDTCLHLVMTKIPTSIEKLLDEEPKDEGQKIETPDAHQKEIIELLVRHPKVDVALRNNDDFSCLHFAALKGNKFAVDMILRQAPHMINLAKSDGFTPLHIAAVNGYTDMVLTFLKQEMCLKDPKTSNRQTPLHLAVIERYYECVKALVDNGADVNAQDEDGDTSLHLAMIEKSTPSEEVLGVALTKIKKHGGEASDISRDRIIELLVKNSSVDMTLKNNNDFSCLHSAALRGNKFVIDQILKVAPHLVNMPKNDGFTPLHLAALNGHVDIVLTLVKQENCEKDRKNAQGQTALHLAIAKEHYKCVKALVENGADVNSQDDDGDTSLHLVAMELSKSSEEDAAPHDKKKIAEASDVIRQEIIDLLIQHPRVDRTLKNNKDFNCLHIAATKGNKLFIDKMLHVAPQLINIPKNDGFTPLHLAAFNGYADIVVNLVKQENCLKDLKNAKGHTALHLAILKRHYECVKVLVDNGADVNAQDDDGDTCVHLVAMKSASSIEKLLHVLKDKEQGGETSSAYQQKITELLVNNPRVDMTVKNNKDFNCLQFAALKGNKLVIDKILQVAPKLLNTAKHDGFTALHLAAFNGFTGALLTLVQQEYCSKDLKNTDGQTALHLAALKKYYECVKVLVGNGADVNAKDKDGNTTLHLILKNAKDPQKPSDTTAQTQEIIQMLIQHPEMDLQLQNLGEVNCLQYAALNGNQFAVERILEANPLLINTTMSDNTTALHIAATNGLRDVLITLLKKETCQKDISNASKQTALHLAVDKCHAECVEALVKHGANVNAQDNHGNTSLHLAIAKTPLKNISQTTKDVEDIKEILAVIKHYKRVIKLLVEHPRIDLTLTDKTDFNCLHHAAINGNTFAAMIMLKVKPTLINTACTKDKYTALHLAALNGHTDVVATLCKQENCTKDPLNANRQTPLHLAADNCNAQSVEILLNEGADRNAQDKDGDTCLHVLLKKSSTEETTSSNKQDIQHLIRLFIEHKIDLTLKDKNGDICLHCAAFSGNKGAVEMIIEAAPWVINDRSDTFTALHIASLYDQADVVKTLAEQGNCAKDLLNSNSQTALHIAVDKNHYRCIEALVNNGANVNTQDGDGNTSLHLVMMKESTQNMLASATKEELLDLAKIIEEKGNVGDEKTNLVALVTTLLQHGANVHLLNSKQMNTLHLAQNSSVKSFLEELFERFRPAPKQPGT